MDNIEIDLEKFESLSNEVEDQWDKVGKPWFDKMTDDSDWNIETNP